MVDKLAEEQVEEQYDQSLFASNQSVLQAPPQEPMDEAQIKAAKKKKMIYIGVAVFVLLMLAIVIAPKKRRMAVESTPEPSPTPVTQQTEMQQQLRVLEQSTIQSDPDKTLVTPPEIDMQVEF